MYLSGAIYERNVKRVSPSPVKTNSIFASQQRYFASHKIVSMLFLDAVYIIMVYIVDVMVFPSVFMPSKRETI